MNYAGNLNLTVENGGVTSNQARLGVVSAVHNRAKPGSVASVFATGFGELVTQLADGTIVSGALLLLQQDILLF